MNRVATNKKFHAILGKLGLNDKETKKGMALTYSKGRTEHTSELTDAEYSRMLSDLDRQPGDWQNTPENRKRRRILCLAHQLDWETETGAVDMDVLNAFLTSPRCKAGKPLNQQTLSELSTTIYQMEQMLFKDYAK